ncbi:MAG: hypothetical protein RL557_662 [archaeon]
MESSERKLLLKKGVTYKLCTCELSKILPLCDESHKEFNERHGTYYKSFKITPSEDIESVVSSKNWEQPFGMFIKEDTKEMLEHFAAETIAEAMKKSIIDKGKVIFGVVGGRNVSGIFSLLSSQQLEWGKVHIFLLDERKSGEGNGILAQTYFSGKAIVHLYENMMTAQDYEKEFFQQGDRFDIILASSGEDGHIASLYPLHDSIRSEHYGFIDVHNSPKPPAERISASRRLIENSSLAVLLFFGEEKKSAFENFLNKNISVVECPAKVIQKVKKSFVLVGS